MPSRKALLIGIILLLVGVIPALAQDQAADQEPTTYIVTGYDIFERALNAQDVGDYQQSVQDLTLFILLNPTWGQGYFWRGQAYALMNDLDNALADYTQALAYPSPAPEITGQIYGNRALIYLQQDNLEAAQADLDAAVEAAPDLPDAYYYRAQLHSQNQDLDAALADYNKLVELAPDFPAGYSGRAVIQAELGNDAEALADFDRWIELEPDNPTAYYQRSLLKSSQDDAEGALADVTAAIQLQPRQPAFYLQRASLNTTLGDSAAAAADYLQWIRFIEIRGADVDQLVPGESLVLSFSAGVSYSVSFNATSGQVITLSATTRPESDIDPLLVLLDTNGTPVAADDDSGGGMNALITDYAVSADGIYTLIVSHSGGGTDGPVRLLLEVD